MAPDVSRCKVNWSAGDVALVWLPDCTVTFTVLGVVVGVGAIAMIMCRPSHRNSAGLVPKNTRTFSPCPPRWRPTMSTSWPACPAFGNTPATTGTSLRMTVSVAAFDVALPAELVNTARYSLPDSDSVAVPDRVVEVAPDTLLHVVPPSVDTCHWTVGVGVPDAAAVNVAVVPATTVTFAGCLVIAGLMAVVVVVVVVVDEVVVVGVVDVVVDFVVLDVVVVDLVVLDVVVVLEVVVVDFVVLDVVVVDFVVVDVLVDVVVGVVVVLELVVVVVTAGLTVNVATLDVVDRPEPLLSTASYSLPDSVVLVGLTVNVADVPPGLTSANVVPPSVDTFH